MSMDSNRPPRKKVKHYDNGEPHFLTFSCYHRLKLLSKDQSRQWFVDALNDARIKHGFHLWAWVIMPEHVHVLLWPPFDLISPDPGCMQGRIEGILTSLKRPVGIKAIEFLRNQCPEYLTHLTVVNAKRTYHRFWQAGSGHDENVSAPESLHALVDYVHLNPVRRGLVDRSEDWPWSSARDWLRLLSSHLKVDRTIPDTLDTPWKNRNSTRSE
jgi:putative transposase